MNEEETCDDCGTTKGLVGDLKGTLCSDCMSKRSREHFDYLEKTKEDYPEFPSLGIEETEKFIEVRKAWVKQFEEERKAFKDFKQKVTEVIQSQMPSERSIKVSAQAELMAQILLKIMKDLGLI